MTLREYCRIVKGEIEVWDAYIDLGIPYYNEDGKNCFEDSEEDHYLFLMENWFLSLPVTSNRQAVCSVDCYHAVESNWDRILKGMQEDGGYNSFLNSYDDWQDDEMIADYVEDIFTTMSQGYYSMAKDFCLFMGLC